MSGSEARDCGCDIYPPAIPMEMIQPRVAPIHSTEGNSKPHMNKPPDGPDERQGSLFLANVDYDVKCFLFF